MVTGQRLMQAASDIFLGWLHVDGGLDGRQRDFYCRQLKDWKGSAEVERMVPAGLSAYGGLCGWTLARAHARSGDRCAIAAYLGEGRTFDRALVEYRRGLRRAERARLQGPPRGCPVGQDHRHDGPLRMTDISSLPQADQEGIGATLIALRTGFQERDAGQLDSVYTDDADWVNAFGSVRKGSEEIISYLRGLFADENFNAGVLRGPPEIAIRVLTPEVVLVSAHLQVEGQKLLEGGEIELRDNFSLRVLHRQADGSWRIVSEMFNDANREGTYVESS